MLNLLENKYIMGVVEGNLHQVFIFLLAYHGEKSFRVGLGVGGLVNCFANKYMKLYDIFLEN